jgi:hypothetical protein
MKTLAAVTAFILFLGLFLLLDFLVLRMVGLSFFYGG